MVRCHGAVYNVAAAQEIKRQLGIPYVVSMHTNPDQALGLNIAERIQRLFLDDMAQLGLNEADVVLPVYRGIEPYLQRLGVARVEVAYNAVNPGAIKSKSGYRLNNPVRVISVGRQIEGKNPKDLIEAVAGLPHVELTLVGDGPLHDDLRMAADRHGIAGRITFVKSLANNELCRRLFDQDIFALHNDYWGVPKTLLEAFLTGLPVSL